MIARRFSQILAGNLVGQLGTLGIFVLAARASTPSEFGKLTALLALAVVGSDVLDFGGNAALTRFVASGASEGLRPLGRAKGEARRKALMASTLLLAIGVVALAVWGFSEESLAVMLSAALGGVRAVSQVSLASLLGCQLYKAAAGFNGIDRGVAFAFLAVLVSAGLPVLPAFFAALTFGSVVAGSTAVLILRRVAGAHSRSERRPVARSYWEARHFGLAGVATTAVTLDVAIVAAVSGAQQAGLYAVAARFILPVGTAATSLATVIFASRSGAPLEIGIRSLTLRVFVGTAAALSPLFLLADVLPGLFFGEEYSDSSDALRLLCLAALTISLASPVGSILNAAGHEAKVARLHLVGSPSYLACVTPAAHFWGPSGVASAFCLYTGLTYLGLLLSYYRTERTDFRRVSDDVSHE